MRKAHLWILLPFLLIAFGAGAYGLYQDTVWGDEAHSIEDAGGPVSGPLSPAEIWAKIARRNPWHTPGYFITLSGWGRLTGWEPPALRSLSLLAGMLAIAWTYRLGTDVISPRVGLFAALILSISAYFVYYLHEIRMYTIAAMLVAFELWLYHRIVNRRKPHFREWLALLLGAVALFYTHYFAAIPLVALGLYHVLFTRKNRRWWQVTGVFALAGLAFAPWLNVLLSGLNRASETDSETPFSLGGDTLQRLFGIIGNGNVIFPVVLLVVAIFALRGKARLVGFVTLVAFAGIIGANAALGTASNLGRLRYFMPAWPGVAILLAVGIVQVGGLLPRSTRLQTALPLGLLALWLGIGLTRTLDPNSPTPEGLRNIIPVHHAAYALHTTLQPEDLLLHYLPDTWPLKELDGIRRIRDAYFNWFNPDQMRLFPRERIGSIERDYERDILLENLATTPERQRVWLISSPDEPSEYALAEVQATLTDRYVQCPAAVDLPDLRLDQYTLAPVCCLSRDMSLVPRLTFGDGIGLIDIDPIPAEVTADELRIGSLWSLASDVPPHVYSVTLQVFDSSGNSVAQADHGLVPINLTCEQARIPIGDLPVGTYELRIAVYAWQTGERLSGSNPTSGQTGEMLPIQSFQIAG